MGNFHLQVTAVVVLVTPSRSTNLAYNTRDKGIREIEIPLRMVMPWQGDATQKVVGSNPVLAKDFSWKISVKFYLYRHLIAKFIH